MRSKGRRHGVITPEELYEDFYEVLRDQELPSGSTHGLDALATFYIIFSLVKTGNYDKIGKLKINWSRAFTGKVIRIALNTTKYNSRPYVNEIYLPNDEERKSFFEYLSINIRDRIKHDVSNEVFLDENLMQHKVFSLIYYLYGWGFDRYLNLVEKTKNVYKDKWSKREVIENGKTREQDYVLHKNIRIEYLDHIFSYLLTNGKTDEIKNLIDKIMQWKMTDKEFAQTESKIYYISSGVYGDTAGKTAKEVVDWAFEKYFGLDHLKSRRSSERGSSW